MRSVTFISCLLFATLAVYAQAPSLTAEVPHAPLFAFEKVIQAQHDRRARCPYYLGLRDDWSGLIQSSLELAANAKPSQTTLRENPLAGWWQNPGTSCRMTQEAGRPPQIGVFGRTFTIPDDWASRPCFLRVEAVNCKLSLRIDQSPPARVPFQQLPLDLRLSDQLRPGKHEFQLIIEPLFQNEWSAVPQWSYVGLLDEPYLYCPPPVHILDFSATPGRDAATGMDTLSMTARTRNLTGEKPPRLKLEVYMLDAEGNRVFNRIIAQQLETPPSQIAPHTLLQRVPNPHRSTPESPYEYTVLFALVGPEDRPTQIERMTVQFR